MEEKKKVRMQIFAEVEEIKRGKEFLDELKDLSDKYDVSIQLQISPANQELYKRG